MTCIHSIPPGLRSLNRYSPVLPHFRTHLSLAMGSQLGQHWSMTLIHNVLSGTTHRVFIV